MHSYCTNLMGFFYAMTKPTTQWKPVVGYEGLYEVSEKGQIKNLKTQHVLTPRNSTGYSMVALFKNGERRDLKIHRLVACSFLENPQNKPQVNHKDGNKLNNNLENLEWCTNSENQKHAYQTGLRKFTYFQKQIIKVAVSKAHSKSVIDIKTGIKYSSLTEACIKINMNSSTANKQIHRKSKNQRFKYI